jgi:hypothetical protein
MAALSIDFKRGVLQRCNLRCDEAPRELHLVANALGGVNGEPG